MKYWIESKWEATLAYPETIEEFHALGKARGADDVVLAKIQEAATKLNLFSMDPHPLDYLKKNKHVELLDEFFIETENDLFVNESLVQIESSEKTKDGNHYRTDMSFTINSKKIVVEYLEKQHERDKDLYYLQTDLSTSPVVPSGIVAMISSMNFGERT